MTMQYGDIPESDDRLTREDIDRSVEEDAPESSDDRVAELEAELKKALKRAEKAEGIKEVVEVQHQETVQRAEEAEVRAEAAEAEADEFRPTKDIKEFLMETAEDVKVRFGEQKLRDLAETEIRDLNQKRTKEGYTRIKWEPAEWDEAVDRAILELLSDRVREAPPIEGPLMKTLKMVKPDGTLIQVPYEAQINNLAGSLEDAIARYRKKGYKLTDPLLCPSQNCYEISTLDSDGTYLHGAYCTADHRRRTEQLQRGAVENPVTAPAIR